MRQGLWHIVIAVGMLCASIAHGATVTLPDVSAGVGDEVSITVYVDNPDGVLGYFFDIAYHSSILQYVGTQSAGLTFGWSNLQVNSSTPGQLIVTDVGDAALPSGPGGGLVEIRFEVKGSASGTSPLHFTDAELNDGVITAIPNDGSVSVGTTAKLGVPPLSFCPSGGTLDLPILIQGPSTANGLYVEISYDTNVLSFVNSDKSDAIGDWQYFDNHQSGRILIAASGDTANLTPSARAATIQFIADGPGATLNTETPIIVEIAEYNDDAGATLPTTGIIKIGNNRDNIWVDFGWVGNKTGAQSAPVNDLWAAMSLAHPQGHPNFPSNIKIKGDVGQTYYPGPVSLDTPAEFLANNGPITIGATPTKAMRLKLAIRKLLKR